MSRPHRHVPVVIYTRPWRRLFRKSYELRCWTCPIVVREQ